MSGSLPSCLAAFLSLVPLLHAQNADVAAVAQNAPEASLLPWLKPVPAVSNRSGMQGLLYERWVEAGGNTVRGFQRSQRHTEQPTVMGLAESTEVAADKNTEFGGRFRGYITPPRSGHVRFVVSSDDNSEIWLSPGRDPFARRRIAWIAGQGYLGYTKPFETDRIASQWSSVIELKQGHSYYLEAYHKQGMHDGNFSLRWQWEDEKKITEIPTAALRPWDGTPGDTGDDGLPDMWQKQTGLADQDEAGAWGDPDGDGVMNFDEYTAGTDPMNGNGEPGFLLWEIWSGIAGRDVADLKRAPAFSGPADRAVYVQGGDTPVETATNFGSRLSGYIVPNESGEYQLSVSGDDSVELWIARSGNPLEKELVAFSDRWKLRNQWDKSPTQATAPLQLLAGQACYVEVLHKDDKNLGWISLGWRMRGEKNFTAISPQFLRSPAPNPSDPGRHFLPEKWVDDMTSGFTPEQKRRNILTEHGDPDGDHIPNWMEARLGSDPFSRTGIPGTMAHDWWYCAPGTSLNLARINGTILRAPSNFSLTNGLTAETDTTDGFVSRMRGMLTVPASGSYRFGISGDDHCELWISENDRKFNKRKIAAVEPAAWQDPNGPAYNMPGRWGQYPTQQSEPVRLKKGERIFIEVIHQDRGGPDHVSVAWQLQRDGAPSRWATKPIDPSQIVSYAGDPDDLDDDYLPDSWEKKFGLDVADNGSRDHGKQGEDGDFDGDRLTNREEFLAGTNPCSADTDGDGLGDFDEIHVYGSNPARRDASPPVKYGDFTLGGVSATPGSWMPGPDGSLLSISRRATADFSFELDKPGIFLVELKARVVSKSAYVPSIPVVARIDGRDVGRADVVKDGSEHRWLTPFLSAGPHTVTIDNRNFRHGLTLEITSLSLYRHEGEDADGNSIPDWMEGLFRKGGKVNESTVTSNVSPLCLEGTWRMPDTTTIESSGQDIKVMAGLEGRWYANVPLDPAGPTIVSVTHENGAFRDKQQLTWTTTNLFDAPDQITVRTGDSLKVSANPGGSGVLPDPQASITLDGVEVENPQSDGTRVVAFDKPGQYELRATAVSGNEKVGVKVAVRVVQADFGAAFNISAGIPRIWSLPAMPHDFVLQSDALLTLEEVVRKPSQSRRLIAWYPQGGSGAPRVIARTSPGGPIATSTTVNAFWIVSARDTRDARVVQVLPDGTRVVEFSLTIDGHIPSDLALRIELFVPDAVFADGGTTYELTAADFDENGIARIIAYKAPGKGVAKVCHRIFSYADDNPDGDDGEIRN